MTRRKKKRAIRPDEEFRRGPLRVARYGKNIVYQSNWSEGTFEEWQAHAITKYPKIVAQIDGLVETIAKLVSELPPEKLLHRAWWEFAARAIKIEAESDVGPEDSIAYRMIDYIQSIVASVPPATTQRDDVTEEDWQTLRETVDTLFRTINTEYQICRTQKAKAEDTEYSDDFEEFYFKAQMYWCNVRGQRYQVHEMMYLQDLFLPHSEVLEELFGLTAEEFVDEMSKILKSLTFGLQDIFEEMEAFRKDTIDAVDTKLKSGDIPEGVDFPALMQMVIAENGWQARQENLTGRFLGWDLYDVMKVTSLPQNLVDELSWRPGEEQDFFAEGEFRGWPLRIWPIFKRPFLCLNDRYYCYDLHGLFDNIYRCMQRILFRLKPEYRETWNAIQQQQTEELPFQYLTKLLPGATVYRSVYYRWYNAPSAKQKNWCEADGLLVYDDHLFIIEARAGAFTYTSPANDFPAFISSLKNLVLKPATQGQRFLGYLSSDETVPIFDKGHNEIGELTKSDFRQITICPVTLDPFTEMAAQAQHLRKIGVDVGKHPVWALSVDDLRVYSDVFDDPLRFLHYVDQRTRAFQTDVIHLDDELDHLGLYLRHNDYALYSQEMKESSDADVNFTGYRSDIDKFFLKRLYDPTSPCPLKQDTPHRLQEIVAFLSNGNSEGRAHLAGYLLDLDFESRQRISASIETDLASQPTSNRPRPCSSHEGVLFTIFCYLHPWCTRNAAAALEHARTVLLLNGDQRRLLIELTYSPQKVLSGLNWQWVTEEDIPAMELPRLRHAAEQLREKRIATAKQQNRKIGRNERCPCGSGLKYKKCCMEA
ncbi:SEC-C metal-binding domain-containing protein [Labrenzia sp. DG1229]|uniref:SEC-C metal-binding domain-containing protein n=1 Tax=Labrenzia sp. DG1229 TaxID=681847 RepID=UPI00068E432E|nr:SEC-C metal-binding domain-containing protein [Labrenzia sp. DG1229]